MEVIINSAQDLIVLTEDLPKVYCPLESEVSQTTVKNIDELIDVIKEFKDYEIEVWDKYEANKHLIEWCLEGKEAVEELKLLLEKLKSEAKKREQEIEELKRKELEKII